MSEMIISCIDLAKINFYFFNDYGKPTGKIKRSLSNFLNWLLQQQLMTVSVERGANWLGTGHCMDKAKHTAPQKNCAGKQYC